MILGSMLFVDEQVGLPIIEIKLRRGEIVFVGEREFDHKVSITRTTRQAAIYGPDGNLVLAIPNPLLSQDEPHFTTGRKGGGDHDGAAAEGP